MKLAHPALALVLTAAATTVSAVAAPGTVSAVAAPATASAVAAGSFSVLTYNIAGLPEPISGSDPDNNTGPIGQRINAYDIVNVQEDFNYHGDLYAADQHPYRTSTSGIAGFGDGLNTLSSYPLADLTRVEWNDCSGTDCLTPKGFSWSRVRLAEGVFVDLYNVHADAGTSSDDLRDRRKNITQMSSFIATRSQGNAVIVMGDTNTRYSRAGDNIRLLTTANGLTDAWVQRVRGGEPPAQGGPSPTCDRAVDPNPCEEVDKIFYRSNRYVTLRLDRYGNEGAGFLDDDGDRLSDHDPVAAWFSWSTNPDLRLSDVWGGPHGNPFTDLDGVLVGWPVRAASIRTGSRLDRVGITLGDGTDLSHGGSGGTARSLALGAGEYFDQVILWQGTRNGTVRIFRIELYTNLGNVLYGGTLTSSSVTYTAPPGFMIGGFHGRADAEVDRLGVIYTPLTTT
jgi:endonuclease/exonuclease/phosphatase (EEP) superfamily protein YafD